MEPRPTDLRRAGEAELRPAQSPPPPLPIDAKTAELVGDLIEASGLVPSDRLALARGRARQGERFADALAAEGLASAPEVGDLRRAAVAEEPIAPTDFFSQLDRPGQASAGAVESPARPVPLDGDPDLPDLDEEDLEEEDGVSDGPIVRIVNSVILQAAEDGASDVHFEAQEDGLVVRYRIDGVLQEVQRIPKRLAPGVTTRLKVLAKLDIAERRRPQDGRISLRAASAGRRLDIRVATLPTVAGETVVMRLLDKSKKAPTLEELGLSNEMRATLSELVAKPTGALLVTGPTGSGKSTTLYAALTQINRPEINIITVEDPVEYRLSGVNQVQINLRAGLTFASALRSILRSDPDVVMVGEVRDGETAKIAIEAAMTGHLVLTTLHTNDAPSTITRLNEMGVEPFLTGSAVSAVLAQRLARKLCSHCCEMYSPSVEELIEARVSPDVAAASDGMVFYRKRGCPRCNQTGYRGRIGIFQLLLMNEALADLAVRKATRDEIEREAMGTGMRTLWDDGMAKVTAGLTSIEELARVLV